MNDVSSVFLGVADGIIRSCHKSGIAILHIGLEIQIDRFELVHQPVWDYPLVRSDEHYIQLDRVCSRRYLYIEKTETC